MSILLVLVRGIRLPFRSQNSRPLREAIFTLIQRGYGDTWVLQSQIFEIKAERERDIGSVFLYVTVASERSNAEIGNMTKKEGFGLYDQVTKRTWWMPWRQKAMKDV